MIAADLGGLGAQNRGWEAYGIFPTRRFAATGGNV
jgi:hypothetical protein